MIRINLAKRKTASLAAEQGSAGGGLLSRLRASLRGGGSGGGGSLAEGPIRSLGMARGAGEVAPLMITGVVKLAPDMPFDGTFPFLHLERKFMHLGFHIFDVGFQSRNSEAGKPMVFVTTMLLIGLIASMNMAAIIIRNRLKRKFVGSQF